MLFQFSVGKIPFKNIGYWIKTYIGCILLFYWIFYFRNNPEFPGEIYQSLHQYYLMVPVIPGDQGFNDSFQASSAGSKNNQKHFCLRLPSSYLFLVYLKNLFFSPPLSRIDVEAMSLMTGFSLTNSCVFLAYLEKWKL